MLDEKLIETLEGLSGQIETLFATETELSKFHQFVDNLVRLLDENYGEQITWEALLPFWRSGNELLTEFKTQKQT